MNKSYQIEFTLIDKVIVVVSLFLLIISWVYTIAVYNDLPETIATHFNGAGKPDGYNNKLAIWLAPTIFSILSLVMIYGAKRPLEFDISEKIKNEKQALTSSKTFLLSSLLLSFILILIVHSMIAASITISIGYNWVFPVLLSSIAVFIILIFILNLKNKRK